MDLLVIGSGGREHAIAWRLAQSPRVGRVYVAPGNAGTAAEKGVANVPITDVDELVAFARREAIGLTVVGPEGPLAQGIVEASHAPGLRTSGPTRSAERLKARRISPRPSWCSMAFQQRTTALSPTPRRHTPTSSSRAHRSSSRPTG